MKVIHISLNGEKIFTTEEDHFPAIIDENTIWFDVHKKTFSKSFVNKINWKFVKKYPNRYSLWVSNNGIKNTLYFYKNNIKNINLSSDYKTLNMTVEVVNEFDMNIVEKKYIFMKMTFILRRKK